MKNRFRSAYGWLIVLCTLATPAAAGPEGQREFAGLSFGVGISVTIDTGEHARVRSADIVDGVVRVDSEQNKIARVMLESHYFFLSEKTRLFGIVPPERWGLGPFIALQPGTDEIIEAVALGVMVGFRRAGTDSGSSWNLGLGWVTDPNVQILGDGFVANEAPPGNETEVRYKQTSQDGIVLLVSFSF